MSDNKINSNQSFLAINRRTIIRGLLLCAATLVVVFILICIWGGLVINNKYRQFLFFSKMSQPEIISLVKTIQPEKYQDCKINFLILGTDETKNRLDTPQLTDSIILAQLDTNEAQLTTLSLPRDLWNDPYKTKINALYEYGKDRYPDSPQQFTTEIIEEMTRLNFQHTLVMSMDEVAQIVDLVGGISVNVETGFTDDQFPKNDVDIQTEHDPDKLYETVTFEPGPNYMNGTTVLKYIRSRHSSNLDEGTDIARSQRQQQVLLALIDKLSQPLLHWQHPEISGKLIKFYQDNYNKYLAIDELISMASAVGKDITKFKIHSLSLSEYPDDPNGIIEHPGNLRPYQNQWVYIIKDMNTFQQFINLHF